jgi:hypothetical protein
MRRHLEHVQVDILGRDLVVDALDRSQVARDVLLDSVPVARLVARRRRAWLAVPVDPRAAGTLLGVVHGTGK